MSILNHFFNKKTQTENQDKRMEHDSFHEEPDNEEESMPVMNMEAVKEMAAFNKEIEYEIVEREIQPAKIICPDCGGITLEGLEFCDKCGGELV